MMNKLGFLGVLGLLGVLGFITDNKYYLCFFSFLVFFRYFFVIPDELFRLNVRRAASPAFFTGAAVQTATIAVNALTNNDSLLIAGLSLSFSISMFLFIILLVISEFKEQKKS